MRFEDLEVWKRSARLCADVYRGMQLVKELWFSGSVDAGRAVGAKQSPNRSGQGRAAAYRNQGSASPTAQEIAK